MNYCAHCRAVFDAQVCPRCGPDEIREARPDDPVFLIGKDVMWSGLACDLLSQNGIPFLKESCLGTGLTAKIGSWDDTVYLYVRYADMERAQALMREVFSEDVDGE